MSRLGNLLRSFGPECPKCGCPMNLADAGRHNARPWARFKCEACNHEQTIGRVPPAASGGSGGGVVVYQTTRCKCPFCRALNPPVVSTPSPGVRWHKCDKCKERFQSIEEK